MPIRTSLDVSIDLPWRAYLPQEYVESVRVKIELYRRLSRIHLGESKETPLERLADFRRELLDRFGPIPEPAEWLHRLHELRLLAAGWQVSSIHMENRDVVLGYRNRQRIDKLAGKSAGRLRVVDAQSAYFRLKAHELEPSKLYPILKALLQ